MHAALIVLACISLLANPVYNIDSANIQYTATLSATGYPVSLSYDIGVAIEISPGGVADVDLDLGPAPANWSDMLPDEITPLFILTTSAIMDRLNDIDGWPMPLIAGVEGNAFSRYFGANILYYEEVVDDAFGRIKWNTATGILLSLHIEYDDGIYNYNFDIEYQGSDVNIYSDQNVLAQFGNQALVFLLTPLGIIIIIALVVVIIILAATRPKHHHRRR